MREYAALVFEHTGVGRAVLEVAPGSGYLSIDLAKKELAVTGVEISPDFV
jgi:16S rRNA A1518/A1519 N6-dimethyltransferase RsmA/KsgA/DIM1 with predicted DNA glycosylase/AP lyase activity